MTGPIHKIVSRRQRFARLLVWHPINTDPHDDDRWTVRIWLPLYDILVMLAGWRAYVVGSPLLGRLFSEQLVNTVAAVFFITGAVTMVGVIIPKLWRIEAAGKIGISFLLITYAMLVLSFPSKEQDNSFVVLVLIMATWGVYPRLTKLFIRGVREARKRKELRRIKK